MEKKKPNDCKSCPTYELVQKIQMDALRIRSLLHLERKQEFKFLKGKEVTFCLIHPN